LAFIYLIAASSCAKAPSKKIWSEFSGEKALNHVQSLVDLGPRPAGSDAIVRARAYIEEQLESTFRDIKKLKIPIGRRVAIFFGKKVKAVSTDLSSRPLPLKITLETHLSNRTIYIDSEARAWKQNVSGSLSSCILLFSGDCTYTPPAFY